MQQWVLVTRILYGTFVERIIYYLMSYLGLARVCGENSSCSTGCVLTFISSLCIPKSKSLTTRQRTNIYLFDCSLYLNITACTNYREPKRSNFKSLQYDHKPVFRIIRSQSNIDFFFFTRVIAYLSFCRL